MQGTKNINTPTENKAQAIKNKLRQLMLTLPLNNKEKPHKTQLTANTR